MKTIECPAADRQTVTFTRAEEGNTGLNIKCFMLLLCGAP